MVGFCQHGRNISDLARYLSHVLRELALRRSHSQAEFCGWEFGTICPASPGKLFTPQLLPIRSNFSELLAGDRWTMMMMIASFHSFESYLATHSRSPKGWSLVARRGQKTCLPWWALELDIADMTMTPRVCNREAKSSEILFQNIFCPAQARQRICNK